MGSHVNLKATLIFFIITVFSFSAADDAAVMSKLLAAISPAPKNWSATTHFCTWKGVSCDNSTRVTKIYLGALSLSGTLPSDLGSLTQLTGLYLQDNFFSGPIPSLSNLTFLQELLLYSNQFTSIPTNFFQGLTSLKIFTVGGNSKLSPWTIPTGLTQASNLFTFDAGNANVFGSLPDIFGSLPNLTNIRLSYNNLTGPLPNSFAGPGIQNLWLRDNQFTGLVPPSLFSMSSLQDISLEYNLLQGPYPKFPSTVTTVTVDGNSFCKNASGSCDPLVTILLEVASDLGYPIKLAKSWQGNDACTNWNYITCDSLGNIITVNLTQQQFMGTISPAFANLTSLRNLYLNDNNLTGSIPDSLATMPNLQILDVSNNNLNLTGSIPKFASTVKLFSTGNPSLGTNTPSTGGSGGTGGTPSGSDSNSTTPGGSPAGTANGNSVSSGMIAGVVIAVVIFVVVVLFVLIKRHRKVVKSPENGGVPNELQSHIEVRNVAISIQVLRQATNNFSEDNILGRGGFGVVYKGELHNGTKIAVKRMESVAMRTRGMNEFQAEIAVLTKVRHRRLVALLGYCINGNERLLVYEYMPQGNLTQHLFDQLENGSPRLTWKQRVTIALDVGRGVEYLHSLAQQSFIHRDLKPANILLGDDMRAKVADFGLVKNAPDENYSMETRVAGTFGYLAPEYAATGRVTTKVDVYAFGVILMQLITGRKAVDHDILPDDLVTWFHRVLINKENISNAIDQTLNPDEESIYKVAELARQCTAREPSQRPDMGHAVNILSPLVELRKPTSDDEEDMISLSQDLQSWRANEDEPSLTLPR